MEKVRFSWLGLMILMLFVASIACSSAVAPTVIPPTSTSAPPTLAATATAAPTSTPKPTATPDLALTQRADARLTLLQTYADKGYITTVSGEFEDINDFHEEWAQLYWYQWWPIRGQTATYGDLLFHGHYNWETAARTSDLSGCGIVFGIQPNNDHYAVFIDKARILFQRSRRGTAYPVGRTAGSGRLNLQEPAEADVDVIIQGVTTYVVVNGQATRYTLSADQATQGEFALSLLSGTNKDFGTRCDITDAYLWLPQE